MTAKNQRIGIYPGTFDPVTLGHLDIIKRALKVADRLIIAVALDTTKKPIFDLKERAEMIRSDLKSALTATDYKRCEVKTFSGLLITFAEKEKAAMIFRGLRAISDFEYEVQMACLNSKLSDSVETIFLPASENTQFISSRFIKEIARLGGDVSAFVSSAVEKKLKAYFKNKRS